jgi:hypothetical protein
MRLRDLLGSSFKIGERVLIAEILSVDLDPYRRQVLINKGPAPGSSWASRCSTPTPSWGRWCAPIHCPQRCS